MSEAPYLSDADVTLYQGDCLEVLRDLSDESVHMCVTSPPFYGLRDYGTGTWEGGDAECEHEGSVQRTGHAGTTKQASNAGANSVSSGDCKCGARRVDQQIGLEETPEQWVERLVQVFREVWRVLRKDGTFWLEVGDSYNAYNGNRGGSASISAAADPGRNEPARGLSAATCKPKDLIGAPWMLAFALRADGWWLRSDIVWAKPNPMPESVTDRPSKSHSYIFMLAKSKDYHFDQEAVREPHTLDGRTKTHVQKGEGSIQHRDGERWPNSGRNVRSVWTIPPQPFAEAHFATFPEELVRRCILAGTSEKGCCPECGAPWVREVEKTPMVLARSERTHSMGRTRPSGTVLEQPTATTTGWRPSCFCGHEYGPDGEFGGGGPRVPGPCTVLDPFMGSGTTALVARKLGRRAVGIDLSAEYLEMAARRLSQQSLFA